MSLMKMAWQDGEGKNTIVFTEPAAGGVTVAANEIALWVGSLIGDVALPLPVHSFVNDLLERLREIGTTRSGAGLYTTAEASWITQVPRKTDINVTVDDTFGTPASNGVQLYIGDEFQSQDHKSVSAAVKRLLENWMENVGKKGEA